MKKLISMMLVLVLALSLLTACGCKHETWTDANCETPKTCADCGETEGDALGLVLFIGTAPEPLTGEAEFKLAQTIAAFLGRHMEG